jgi:hypothetical protein
MTSKPFAGLSGALKEIDFRSSFADAATDLLSQKAADAIQDALKDGQVTEWLIGFAGVAADAAAATIAGPLLKVVLRVADDTRRNLNLIMDESFSTGIAIAVQNMAIAPRDAKQKRFRSEQLLFAYNKLHSAYAFARGRKAAPTRLYVRLVQGLIAEELGADIWRKQHFAYCITAFPDGDVRALQKQRSDGLYSLWYLELIRTRNAAVTEAILENPRKLREAHAAVAASGMGGFLMGEPFTDTDDQILARREHSLLRAFSQARSYVSHCDPLLVFLDSELVTEKEILAVPNDEIAKLVFR